MSREMAHQLRALDTLIEDEGSGSQNAHGSSQLSVTLVPGFNCSLLASMHSYSISTNMQEKHSYT